MAEPIKPADDAEILDFELKKGLWERDINRHYCSDCSANGGEPCVSTCPNEVWVRIGAASARTER